GAAIGLDGVEADGRERLELGVERREVPRAVELERYPVVAHLVWSSFVRMRPRGDGTSDAFAASGVEQGGIGRLEPGLDGLARPERVVGADADCDGLRPDGPPEQRIRTHGI